MVGNWLGGNCLDGNRLGVIHVGGEGWWSRGTVRAGVRGGRLSIHAGKMLDFLLWTYAQ